METEAVHQFVGFLSIAPAFSFLGTARAITLERKTGETCNALTPACVSPLVGLWHRPSMGRHLGDRRG